MNDKNIILASGSPRRTEILTLAHIKHIVIPSTCEEKVGANLMPIEVVESLSYQKAKDVFDKNHDSIVIGADTIVTINGIILGKPKSQEEAIKMLSMLSNNTHQVITGVTIIKEGKVKTFHEITNVKVKALSKIDIDEYLSNEYVYDKAGSYAIQGMFSKHINSISGDYYNVVGLPISRVYQELKEF